MHSECLPVPSMSCSCLPAAAATLQVQPVIDFIAKAAGLRDPRNFARGMTPQQFKRANRAITGIMVRLPRTSWIYYEQCIPSENPLFLHCMLLACLRPQKPPEALLWANAAAQAHAPIFHARSNNVWPACDVSPGPCFPRDCASALQ